MDGQPPELGEYVFAELEQYPKSVPRVRARSLPTRIDDDIVRTFDALTLTDEGVDWDSVRSPSATWTYLVTDEAYGTNALLGLANKPAIGALGVVALGPILFLWALYQHWTRFKRRRQRASRV